MADADADGMSDQHSFDWTTWDLSALIAKNKPPPSVQLAVRFMYTGAAVEALVAILGLAAYFSLWRSTFNASTLQLAPGQWGLAEATGAGVVVVALSRMSMWLWMASKSKAGRRWARVLSIVFFVIASLALVAAIGRRPLPGGEWQLIFPAVVWLVGLCAVALLWRGESGEFFTARSQHY